MARVTVTDTTGTKRKSKALWAWNWALTREREKRPNSRTLPASPGQVSRAVPASAARSCAVSASAQAHRTAPQGDWGRWPQGYGPARRAAAAPATVSSCQVRLFRAPKTSKGKIQQESIQATIDVKSKNKNLLFTKLCASEFITQSVIY